MGASPSPGTALPRASEAASGPGHTDLMVTPESLTPWLARDGAARTICEFLGWPEEGPAFDDAIKLARKLGFTLLSERALSAPTASPADRPARPRDAIDPPLAGRPSRDTERLDWLEKHAVNVRVPLRWGSRDLFWASPDDSYEGEEGPSDIRAKIDAAILSLSPGGRQEVEGVSGAGAEVAASTGVKSDSEEGH